MHEISCDKVEKHKRTLAKIVKKHTKKYDNFWRKHPP